MKDSFYRVTNISTGEVLATRVKIAQDFKSRSIGLLNRQSLDEDEGLLIKPCKSIHTFFMKFPIDVIFLDKSSKILKIVKSMHSARLSGCQSAYTTLELKAGKLEKHNVSLGNTLKFDKI